MIRMLIAVVAANAAAPCLFVLALLVNLAADDTDSPGSLGALLDVSFAALFLSFDAVFSTAFPASLLFALTGRYFRWRSSWIYLAGGAVIGLGFISWHWGFTLHVLRRPIFYWIIAISFACAWLYWLVARESLTEAATRKRS
jgi:hypothetical protein